MSDSLLDIIEENIDIDELFDELDINIHKKINDEYLITCINPDHNDSKPSTFYNIKRHKWQCFGCKVGGDLVDFISNIKEVGRCDGLKFLKKFYKSGNIFDENDDNFLQKKLKRKIPEEIKNVEDNFITYDLPLEFELDFNLANNQIKEYLIKRKLNKLILNKFFIGFCNSGDYKNRLIIPIIIFNKIVCFCARSTWKQRGKIDDRYLYPEKPKLGQLLWGLHNNYIRKNPIFVEGIFDAITLRKYGFNGFTLFNNNVTDDQVKIIDKYFDNDILIMPDNDDGGKIMINSFKKKLSKKKNIQICEILKDDADPDSLTKNELLIAYKNKTNIFDIDVNDEKYVSEIIRNI